MIYMKNTKKRTHHISKNSAKNTSKKPKHSKNTKKAQIKQKAPAPHKLRPAKYTKNQKQAQNIETHTKSITIIQSPTFSSDINTKAGAIATDILLELTKEPKTDEDLALKLNVKVNDARRTLNILNSYGIVKYDVNKDNKGWLIFNWKLNDGKIEDYVKIIEAAANASQDPILPNNCNDFFICKKCYPSAKIVLPFDSAFESGFTCSACGKPYTTLNREETILLFKESTIKSHA